ncbi:hypothetical protein B9Z45_16680, partial [Limnohabitans sp. 2KL-17]|uniref:hypothetical protein n=1 Tax=Limnohabitans sp. 2KL-17 TaxID=1100704 RepID=UPI000DD260D2
FVAAAQVLVNSDIKVSANSVNAAQLPTITNLLTNGSLATSSGWTVSSGASSPAPTWETASFRGTDGDNAPSFNSAGSATGGYIYQNIVTEVGKTYTFQVNAYGVELNSTNSALTLTAFAGSNLGGGELSSDTFTCGPDESGTANHTNTGRVYSIKFVATSTSTSVRILDATSVASLGEDLVVDRAIVFETDTGYISGSTGATDTPINDTLLGTSANDKMAGGTGNDTINGQGGTNTALYTGSRSQYTITIASG